MMMLKTEDIARLKMKSKYDDNASDWIVPPFTLKGKDLNLPKVNGKRVMEADKEERNVQFFNEERSNGYYRSTGQSDEEGEGIQYSDDRKRGRTVIR